MHVQPDLTHLAFEVESMESVGIALRARGLKAKLSPIVEMIVAVGTSLVLWFGARMVLDGRLSTGSLIVFILYLGKMYKPMQELSKMTDTYSKASIGYERIQEVVEMDGEVKDLPGARRARGSVSRDDRGAGAPYEKRPVRLSAADPPAAAERVQQDRRGLRRLRRGDVAARLSGLALDPAAEL